MQIGSEASTRFSSRLHVPLNMRAHHASPRAQLRIRWDKLELAPLLARLARDFPRLPTLNLTAHLAFGPDKPGISLKFEAALAALPDGCWPCVMAVDHLWNIPARAAAQLPRLCPNLRDMHVESKAAADIAACLRGLAAARGLEVLSLWFLPCGPSTNRKAGAEAAAALAALSGLRRLDVRVRVDDSGAERGFAAELLALLPALTSLVSLAISCGNDRDAPAPLRGCADSLVELALGNPDAYWTEGDLELAPAMPSVTELQLLG